MNILYSIKLGFCVLQILTLSLASHNITGWAKIRRQKRTLIFQDSGVAKLVCGVITPMDLNDKKPWRQLNWAMNLQAQYAVPKTPIYWWDKWDGRSLQKAKNEFENYGTYVKDQSRKLLYATIELYLNRSGKNGRKCLQRAICENGEIDDAEGVFAEIVHLLFNPTDDDNIDSDYHEAYQAGRSGVICHTLYPECPLGDGILDNIAVTKTIEYFNRNS